MNSANDVPFATIRNKMIELEQLRSEIDRTRLPKHIAIIMDGNGRWARERLRGRSEGHEEGVNSVHNITKSASDLGVEHLTLYAFSTENWNRPQLEVETLMHLIGDSIRKETPELKANNVRIHLLGDIERLPDDVRKDLENGVRETAQCTGMTLNLCLSYSSRWELTNAVKEIAAKVAANEIQLCDIDERTIEEHLSSRGLPDPDLLIRTGGEHRISNFLLWQIAYSELYFTPTLWPDFGERHLIEAILDYQRRERRYGKTSEQVKGEQ